jgi:succinoglycan biosynthesis protein ExoA
MPEISSTDHPFVTIILPAYNEEHHLERCLWTLLDDPYPTDRLEILIVDGGSTDRTREIARRLASDHGFVRVLHNPRRLQAAAVNMGLRAADLRAECIMRCDVHAEYPTGFISRAVASLRRHRAALVAYADAPKAESHFQAAVAFAQNTPLGVGNASYRLGRISGFVDHGKHGCFDRAALEEIGGYDESFSHNEDSELSLRLVRSGGRIWLDTGLCVAYYPRTSLPGLARQYYLYGRGRARTVLKHHVMPRWRQCAPPLLLLGEAILLPLGAFTTWALAPLLLYVVALCLAATYGTIKTRNLDVLLAVAAFATMHHAWGYGFLRGMAQGVSPGGSPSSAIGETMPR